MLSGEELNEIKHFFPLMKYFIFGHARSGTTLLARLIRLHPEVHCNWQAHFFTRPPRITALVSNPEVSRWLSRRHNRWNRGSDPSTAVMRTVCDYILERDARAAGKTIVGDKSPNTDQNEEAVRLLHTIYPDGSLIVVLRDGRDVVLSHLFQDFVDHPEYLSRKGRRIRAEFLSKPDLFYSKRRSLFTAHELRGRALRWADNVNKTEAAGRQLFRHRFLQVRYEDLIDHPAGVMREIWSFLGVSEFPGEKERVFAEMEIRPDATRQREVIPPLAKSVKKGGPGLWEEYFTSRDREIFKQAAGQSLIKYSYEKDENW
jgi:hypothetical protein